MAGFDWVTARAKCSLEAMFQTLGEVIDSDVKTANALNRAHVRFTASTEARNKFIVARIREITGFTDSKAVVFELNAEQGEIVVRERTATTTKDVLHARPSLNPDGECLFSVMGEDQPVQLWQLSRKALESLFFEF